MKKERRKSIRKKENKKKKDSIQLKKRLKIKGNINERK